MPSLFKVFSVAVVAVAATFVSATPTTNSARAEVGSAAEVRNVLQGLVVDFDNCTKRLNPGLLQLILLQVSAFKPVADCVGNKIKEATAKIEQLSGSGNAPVFYPNMQSTTQLTAQAANVVKTAANRVIPGIGGMGVDTVLTPALGLLDELMYYAHGETTATGTGDLVQVISSVVS